MLGHLNVKFNGGYDEKAERTLILWWYECGSESGVGTVGATYRD